MSDYSANQKNAIQFFLGMVFKVDLISYDTFYNSWYVLYYRNSEDTRKITLSRWNSVA